MSRLLKGMMVNQTDDKLQEVTDAVSALYTELAQAEAMLDAMGKFYIVTRDKKNTMETQKDWNGNFIEAEINFLKARTLIYPLQSGGKFTTDFYTAWTKRPISITPLNSELRALLRRFVHKEFKHHAEGEGEYSGMYEVPLEDYKVMKEIIEDASAEALRIANFFSKFIQE